MAKKITREHVTHFTISLRRRLGEHAHEVIIAICAAEPSSRIVVAIMVITGVVVVLAWQAGREVWGNYKMDDENAPLF